MAVALAVLAGSAAFCAANPVIIFTASPANGSPGPTEGSDGDTYSTSITWIYSSLAPGVATSISTLEIDDPNQYGGNFRDYVNPAAGSFSAQTAFYLGSTLSEYAIGIPPEGGSQAFLLSGPTTYYAAPPGAKDTVSFGYLGPNGPLPPGPPGLTTLANGMDAYTVQLGGQTVAETDAGFYGQPSDSTITFALSGTYTSTDEADLGGQSITFTGSGTFTTEALNVTGILNVNGGTLQGTDSVIVDNTNGTLPATMMTLTGSGAVLAAPDYVIVGNSDNGPACVLLQQGAKMNAGIIAVGEDEDSNGSLTANGSTINANNFVEIGAEGTGTLTVENSSSVNITTSNGSLTIGAQDGGVGTATITGGSTVSVSGQVVVGAPDSTGNVLSILDGATLTCGSGSSSTFYGVVAGQTGGAFSDSGGSVDIDGAGSQWTINGSLSIGSGGTATVTVENGGTLAVNGSTIELGHYSGASGALVFDAVSGVNPSFEFTSGLGQIIIGDQGVGHANVQDGAQITSTAAIILGNSGGNTTTGNGTGVVTEAGSSWTNYGNMTDGQNGVGEFLVLAGGTLQLNGELDIAAGANSIGTFTADGTNTSATVGNATVGDAGDGTLNATGGANLTTNDLVVAAQAGSTGNVVFSDDQTNVTVNGDMTVGQAGAGTAALSNQVNVAISGGSLTVGGGQSGVGLLTLDTGASLSTDDDTTVGDVQGAQGTITIGLTDAADLTVGGNLTVGGGGSGTLLVNPGSSLTVQGDTISIGDQSTGNGLITMNGSTLSFAGNLIIGNGGKGELLMQQGAQNDITGISYDTPSVIVGSQAASSGTLALDGSGTSMQVSELTIGESGTGMLKLTNKAVLTSNGDVTVADQVGGIVSSASVASSSMLAINGNLTVGSSGIGTLQVATAGQATATGNIILGDNVSGNGVVTVTGNGSSLGYGQTLTVGNSGFGSLSITAGGLVAPTPGGAGEIDIAAQTGSTGSLTVSGTGSKLVANTLIVGGTTEAAGGTASLIVSNSGELTVSGVLKVWNNSHVSINASDASIGSISIAGGGSIDASGSLLLNYTTSSADPIASIASYLQSGYNGGSWNGPGINSSSVANLNASQSALIYSVGYADGADGITGVPSGQIEIMPTLAGDAKLQGNVVFGDFQLLSQYFGQSGTSWDEGNFSYGNSTNFGDFQLLSQNFGANASALTAGQIASINSFAAQFGEELTPSGSGYSLVSVPEPASVGMLAAVSVGVLARRRRSDRAK
jgi:T5SS/PEP-CTERM-associated repeat protein